MPVLRANARRALASFVLLVLLVLLLPAGPSPLQAAEPAPGYAPEWSGLVTRLKADGFTDRELFFFHTASGLSYDSGVMGRKLRALFNRKYEGTPPKQTTTAKPKKPSGPRVYKTVMVPEKLARAVAFRRAHEELLDAAFKTYGVPGEIVVGILTVETDLGTYLGDKRALETLASMAAADGFAAVEDHFKDKKVTKGRRAWIEQRASQKAAWAYDELKALLSHCGAEGLDPVAMPSSVYGAVGICQFMPSNILKFGVDGDADGSLDLFTLEDAVFSLSNYLKGHGWKPNLSRSGALKVLYRYNHSHTYANTVHAVADYVRERVH